MLRAQLLQGQVQGAEFAPVPEGRAGEAGLAPADGSGNGRYRCGRGKGKREKPVSTAWIRGQYHIEVLGSGMTP